MSNDAAFEEWIERAKAAPIKDVAEHLGARLKRAGHEWVGLCPACGGDDRFSINTKKAVFNCRGSKGGSVLDMVMHVNGGDFLSACEFINGEPPPRGESRGPDHDAIRERQKERREADRRRDEQHAQEQAKKRTAAEEWWDSSAPIEGTHALAYLRARGLNPAPSQTINLGFIAAAPLYSGDTDPETGKPIKLGVFPCMIAAIRNVKGAIIGAHRTYLDPKEPRKLVLPDGQKAGKKILGEVMGGAIWLGEPLPTTAIAEGIETALAFGHLWTGGEIALCAAVSLGNLAGGSKGSRPHPKIAKRTIPNGVPDPERPGVRLPELVREVVILGDGDSDPATTRAHLLTAGRRFRAEGREALVSMAPEGMDWNDALLAERAQGREAA